MSRTSNGFGILDTPRSNLKLKREKENKTYSRGGLGKVTRVEQEDTWIDNTNDPEYDALNLVKENRSPVPDRMRQPRRSLFSEVSDVVSRLCFSQVCNSSLLPKQAAAQPVPPLKEVPKEPTFTEPALVGFPNPGKNICYMNAVLQSLLNGCPDFLQTLMAKDSDAPGMTGAVSRLACQKQKGQISGIGKLLDAVKEAAVKVMHY